MRRIMVFASAVFAVATVPAFAQMTAQSPDLIGGTIVDPADWPASPWVGNCSSTLIGEKVLLVAAHCTTDGGTKTFTIGSTRYSAKCDIHASYRSNTTADWALCVVDKKVEGVPFESLAKVDEVTCKSGSEFLLTGYGCTRWNGGIDGKFRTGVAAATRCPSSGDNDTITRGRIALCSGDSGGGAYMVMPDGSRRVVGVNSRSNTTDTSYLASTYVGSFMRWADTWSAQKNLKICGLHADAVGCKTAPDQGVDCTTEEGAVAEAQSTLTNAQKALTQCRAGAAQ